MPPDESRLVRNVETLDKALDGYERILSTQPWLAGDHLTVVDFFVPPCVRVSDDHGADRAGT